jgi:hypothetical protein
VLSARATAACGHAAAFLGRIDVINESAFAWRAVTVSANQSTMVAPLLIPLRETKRVKRGEHKPPTCEHGEWRFAGADQQRQATKWRCRTGECTPASRWVKANRLHPLFPRERPRFKNFYHQRGAVEREFGRLEQDWALAPLRVRGLERVRLHADPHDPRPAQPARSRVARSRTLRCVSGGSTLASCRSALISCSDVRDHRPAGPPSGAA